MIRILVYTGVPIFREPSSSASSQSSRHICRDWTSTSPMQRPYHLGLFWRFAVQEFKLSDYSKETLSFTIDPYCGNLIFSSSTATYLLMGPCSLSRPAPKGTKSRQLLGRQKS